MKVKLKLFFKWGICFDENNPYAVEDSGNRKVEYAEKQEIIDAIIRKYHPEMMENNAVNDDVEAGGQTLADILTEGYKIPKKSERKERSGGALRTKHRPSDAVSMQKVQENEQT